MNSHRAGQGAHVAGGVDDRDHRGTSGPFHLQVMPLPLGSKVTIGTWPGSSPPFSVAHDATEALALNPVAWHAVSSIKMLGGDHGNDNPTCCACGLVPGSRAT